MRISRCRMRELSNGNECFYYENLAETSQKWPVVTYHEVAATGQIMVKELSMGVR